MIPTISTCRKCGDEIEKHKGYCRICFQLYARAYREKKKAEQKPKNGHFHYFGPGWLMPMAVPQVLSTISASIVWGVCGRMADVPEY